ncbi:MAG: extracellular solute-binding protein, partial [Halobacteriovoraceae bacterium]|nr:extracellular solute-binding protein [Halobacteriovoraceae bacterium]
MRKIIIDPPDRALALFISAFFFLVFPVKAEIHVWTSSENVSRAMKSMTPQFEKEFGETVVVTILNKDLTTQFKTAAIAGKGPDILCWANDVVGELASSGLIEPLLLEKKFKDSFYPSALKSFTFEGKLYGYPYDVEAVALIRNTSLKKSPFRSFEDLLSWSKAKTNQDNYPFLFDIKNFYFNFMFFSAGGGYIFGDKKVASGVSLNPQDVGLA